MANYYKIMTKPTLCQLSHLAHHLWSCASYSILHITLGAAQLIFIKTACQQHDRNIKNNQFQVRGLVLRYDSKLFKHPGKLKTHLLGPYIVKEIIDGGAMKIKKIRWDRG